MALQYSPKIIQDGLVMCLDASQNKSYPTDLPVKDRLALWLDASDDSTFSYSSGTVVSQWRDKSGNNFHSTQSTAANQPSRSTVQNSRKTVNFDGSNDFLTISNFVCNSEMSIFVVSNCGTTLFIEHSVESNNNWGFYFYGGGGGMFKIKRTNGSFTTQTNWLSGGYSIASGTNSTGLDLLTYKDGTQQSFTVDSRNSIVNSYVTDTLYIGSRAGSSVWTSGPIAEIIIYNKKVADFEIKSIHTYLGQKWGILNTDRSIIDLSGNSNNGLLGNGTTADMPLFDYYNKGAIKFDGSSDYLVVADNVVLNPATVTVSMWLKRNAYQSSICNFLRRNDRDAYALMATYNTDTVWFRIRNSLAAVVDATTTMPLNTWTNLVGTFDGSNVKIYKDGALANTTANTSAISYSGSTIGDLIIARDDIVSGRYAPINVGSTLIYSRALSAAEIAQNYEAQKSKFTNTIVQQGLVLNLDAGNPYSYASTGSTWYDVSGNSINASANGTSYYRNSNGGLFNFPGNSSYYNTQVTSTLNLGAASFSIECWVYLDASTSSDNAYRGIISLGGDANNYIYIAKWRSGLYSGLYVEYIAGGSTVTGVYQANDYNPVSRWTHVIATKSSNVLSFYVNGVFYSSMNNLNTTFTGNSSFYIAQAHAGVNSLNGYIGESRVYNIALSAAQVLQNYNATKGRYGL